ncbi:MAG: Hsp20/alpha crystallin family protein [Spirochaetales bacterium]|nr:Hsp20/alpha crystallin family protein [Spirochaetales bacterium]
METKQITGQDRRVCPSCCDIYEDDGKIILKMEMPGVEKENLDIQIDDSLLKIHAGKNTLEYKDAKYLVREIRDADYHHEFTIDDTIDRNKIDAKLNQGILTLTLHIKESEKPRKINVVAK